MAQVNRLVGSMLVVLAGTPLFSQSASRWKDPSPPEKQEKAVQDGVPTAHVVTVPGGHHYEFLSNEADVLREMRAFLAGLHN